MTAHLLIINDEQSLAKGLFQKLHVFRFVYILYYFVYIV